MWWNEYFTGSKEFKNNLTKVRRTKGKVETEKERKREVKKKI